MSVKQQIEKGNRSMAAVPVTLDGILYDLHNKTTQRVVIIADASLQNVGVGGGPIVPPTQPPQPPLGIWGPTDPRPTNPIAGIPGLPGYNPPPIDPPTPPTEVKPPPDGGGWGWSPEYGWGYFPMTGGKPQPPASA